jgi:nucleoside-diphosphate-sugar epimerase
VIGAGHIGSKVAEAAVKADYDVIVCNATGPESLARLVSQLDSKARAATVEEAAEAGDDDDVVSVPVGAFGDVPVKPWPERSSSARRTTTHRVKDLSPRSTTTASRPPGYSSGTLRGAGW